MLRFSTILCGVARNVRVRRLWWAVVLFSCSLPLRAESLRFAPLPLEDRKVIHEQFQGLASYLGEAVGLEVEMVYLNDYSEILARFRQQEIDLAYLGPLPYAILRRDFADAEPLVCFRDVTGAASYTCSLVAYGGSGLTTDDLQGKHIGLTQPYSTCGYLAVSEMLAEAGSSLEADANSYEYAGSHSSAALGVVQGRYDLAGVKTAIAQRYEHLDLQILSTSRAFPGFTLVANTRTVTAPIIGRLRKALLELDPRTDEQAGLLVASWGIHLRQGAVPPESCDYGGIEEAMGRVPWPIPGARP